MRLIQCKLLLTRVLCGLCLLQVLSAVGQAQISVGDSGVGYIDSAFIMTQVRFRFDAAYEADKPNRAEYLWAWPPTSGPGPANPESSVDYQRGGAYIEWAFDPAVSFFADVGGLFTNPEVNPNSAGIGDIESGMKLALWLDEESAATVQFKVYVPSGDEDRGLGTGHVSLEPGVLLMRRFGQLTFEGELKHWFSVGGTDGRAGNIFRYGAGVTADLSNYELLARVRPVFELVGWSVLDGQASFLNIAGPQVEDVDGDNILNIKAGTRFLLWEGHDLYFGVGHALTGDRWYRDILRAELRCYF